MGSGSWHNHDSLLSAALLASAPERAQFNCVATNCEVELCDVLGSHVCDHARFLSGDRTRILHQWCVVFQVLLYSANYDFDCLCPSSLLRETICQYANEIVRWGRVSVLQIMYLGMYYSSRKGALYC